MTEILNYINGELRKPGTDAWLDNVNPATGKVYSQIPDSDAGDVEAATKAATDAFRQWSVTPVKQRSDLLLRLSALIQQNLAKFAEAESIDNGKPITLATQVDIPRAVSNFHFYGTAALHTHTQAHAMENTALNYTLRQPAGVAGCISPWNLPLYLFSWKIAPALAAGCTVVAKPSEVTPMTAYLLSELCIEAGFPKGVLNIVHGLGTRAGAAIVEHPGIRLISFTGGTKTGEWISRTAAPMFKKLSLELGGKNPGLVFADCDLDHAVSSSLKAAFSNQGEICLCSSRIFIEKTIYDKFRDAFVKKAAAMKVGDPMNPETKTGAIVSKTHYEKILSCIELARQEGGQILCGGEPVKMSGDNAGGYFIQPTVIEHLPHDCRTNQEEIFGPVVTLLPFEKEEEAIAMANSTRYGLAATLFTTNLNRAHRVAAKLDSGIVWVNCWLLRDLRTPFGGMKQSGMGREGGFEALNFFTEEKNVCIKIS